MSLATVAEQVWEPALAHLDRCGALPRSRATALLPRLLGSAVSGPLPPAQRSGLNPDGVPLQLCASARRDGSTYLLIGDPCASVADPVARQRGSIACARGLLRHCGASPLAGALESTFARVLPTDAEAGSACRMGALWLAAGLDRPGFALYAGTAWEAAPEARWARVDRWLATVLRRPRRALEFARALRTVARPESVCLEGTHPDDARAKLYLRLARADATGALGALELDDERVHGFIEDAVGARTLPLAALVFSQSFDLRDGERVDAKVDLCGHCVRRPAAEWVALLQRAERMLGVETGPAVAMLQAPGLELACVGIGLNRDGAVRVNTYAKPLRPAGA